MQRKCHQREDNEAIERIERACEHSWPCASTSPGAGEIRPPFASNPRARLLAGNRQFFRWIYRVRLRLFRLSPDGR